MKKFLAVVMTLVMAFSITVMPASAADVTVEEFFDTVEYSIALIEDTIDQIHNIIGTILGVLGKECPMCTAIHEVNFDDSAEEDVVEDDILVEEIVVA